MHLALASCSNLRPGEVDDHPLHEALRARGCRVETPAWDDPAVDWSRFDACLIRTTWDYPDRREQFVAWAQQVHDCSRLFHPPDVVRWNTRKTYLRDLQDRGVPIAETLWLQQGEAVDLSALLSGRGWRKGFIKPMVGCSARETLPFTTDAAGLVRAQEWVDRLLPAEGLMVQPFLSSVLTEGEYSVFFIGGRLTHVVRKIPVPGDYRVMDDFGAADEPAELPAADLDTARRVRETCERILDCGTLLYARVDFLRDDAGELVVNEVELVEPSLFFRHGPHAADALAEALLARCPPPR